MKTINNTCNYLPRISAYFCSFVEGCDRGGHRGTSTCADISGCVCPEQYTGTRTTWQHLSDLSQGNGDRRRCSVAAVQTHLP